MANDSVKTVAENATSGRVYGGVKAEERRAARRQQFLEAGLEIFGTEGFRAATVRKLCRQAKLTDRYFYESFDNLQTLLTEVYELHMGQIRQRIYDSVMDAPPGMSVRQLVERMLDAYFTALEDPRVARVCMVELEGISPEVEQLYHGYIMSFSDLILELARYVYPQWQLDDEEALMLGMSLVGAMRQAATHWLRSDYAIAKGTVVRAAVRLVMGLIENIAAQQASPHRDA